MPRSALVVGATGLVGSKLVAALARAMVDFSGRSLAGFHVVPSDAIHTFALG